MGSRFVAFLRGMNVGGHTVKMENLRTLFESAGFGNVATYIASGNVIFTAQENDPATIEKSVEKMLKESLGYEVATFVRTISQLQEIVNFIPFPAGDGAELDGTVYIAFLSSAPDKSLISDLDSFGSTTDAFRLNGRELYWLCRTKMSESIFFGKLLEKTVGIPMTTRNSSTVRKISARYGGASQP